MTDGGSEQAASTPDESGEQSGPVCYRHPDRETWVSCTRCGRPICPDCMNTAAVGFQCPDCVREGKRATRVAATQFGGEPRGALGTVTNVLIGINVAVWLLSALVAVVSGQVASSQVGQLLLSGGVTDVARWTAATTAEVYSDGSIGGGIAGGQLWRLVTAGFVHYGVVHLALNMYALWLLGRYCEELLGRWRFLALYLLSGVGGAVAEFLFRSPGAYPGGASASVFGLLAALFFFFKVMKTDVRAIVALLVLNLVFGFFVPNISVLGHVGGLITGGAVGAILAYAPPGKSRTAIQVAGMACVGLVLASLVTVRILQYGLI